MRKLVCVLLLSVSASAVAQHGPALTTLRVAPPAKLLVGKKPAALLPNKAIAPGNRVSTGPGGRAAFQVSGGVLTLGGDSELYLHSTANGESADIARLVLTRGALRAQVAREPGLTPLDLRLNVGPLRLRSLGANLWTAAETRGETVCLLAGSVEIAAEFGTEKLDRPGDCLFFSAQNRRLVLKPDSAETLARKLEQTAFASDLVTGRASLDVIAGPQTAAGVGEQDSGVPVAVDASSPEPDSGFVVVEAPAPPPLPEPEPIPPPAPAAAPPPPVEPALALAEAIAQEPAPPAPPAYTPAPQIQAPARTSAPASTGGGWFVVVASPGNAAAADDYAGKLRNSGIAAAVRSGSGKHRVVVGPFPDRSAATAERAQLQYRLKINGAWILQD